MIWDPRDWPVSVLLAEVPTTNPPVGGMPAGNPGTLVRASLNLLYSRRIGLWVAVALAGCALLVGAGYLMFAPWPLSAISERGTLSQSDIGRSTSLPKSEQ